MKHDPQWWRFINWLWEMGRTKQRFFDHPLSDDDVLELKAHFEKDYPNWKKGDTVKIAASQDELPDELPF